MISATDVSFAYDGALVLAGVGLVAHPNQVVGLSQRNVAAT